jgi:hypothetical protein
VELTADELAIIAAVVHAEDKGEDPHLAALDAVPALEASRDRFHVTLQRLGEDGYLDVALIRGDNRLLGAHVRRALPKAVDAARSRGAEADVLSVSELRHVERVIGNLSSLVQSSELGLPPEEHADLEAQVATIGAQMRSPRPRRRIVVETLRSARNILEGAVGSGLVAGTIHMINQFL